MHTSNNFVLRGGDTAFADRQKALFEQLSIAEKRCTKDKQDSSTMSSDMEIELNQSGSMRRISRPSRKRKSETKQFHGKESIFKRPDGPAPRTNFRSIPDHHKNPHKWVKYSLGDVSVADMSDTSNAQAAFSFLRELKARRENKETQEDEDMETDPPVASESAIKFKPVRNKSTVVFKKSKVSSEKLDAGPMVVKRDDKPVFRCSKIIMPEYVVGQKPKKKARKDKPFVKVDRSKQLKLSHLEEFEGEEGEV